MNRAGALLWVVGVVSGCNAETLSFDDSDATSPDVFQIEVDANAAPDANLAPQPDATLDVEAGPDANPRFGNRGPPDAASSFSFQCRNEADCARLDLGLHCSALDASVGVCVACVTDLDCKDARRPACDPTLNRCVQCNVNNDCPMGEVCLGRPTDTCVPACVNGACSALRHYSCDALRNVCLYCMSDSDCPVDLHVCDLVTGKCGECASDGDCRQTRASTCDRTTSQCVDCLRDSDCGRGSVCVLGGYCFPPTEPIDARAE